MKNSINKGKIFPMMSEALGFYEIPSERHKKYKSITSSIFQKAPQEHIRSPNKEKNPLYHVCNRADQNIFKQYPELNELEQDLKELSLNYIHITGYICDEVVITDAWLNLGKKNATLGDHNHLNSFLSGTYYINFDPNKHSLLSFYNDRLIKGMTRSPSFSLPRRNDLNTMFNTEKIDINSTEGQVLIWKSHLIHGYQIPNPTDNRLTLSFNIMPKVCTDGHIYSFTIES